MPFYLNVVSFGANVPFLKSLICIEGHDNGRRFLAISAVVYLLLLAFLPIYARAGILVFMLLIVTTPILLASSIRRLHDASFMIPLAAIPVIIFWVNVFALTYIDHSAKWTLLLIGIISTLVISTISNIRVRHKHQYQLGYHGPVNSNESNNKNNFDRVEPTLATNVFENLKQSDLEDHLLDSNPNKKSKTPTQSKVSLSEVSHTFREQFSHWFKLNKNLSLAGLAISLLLVIIILFNPNDVHDEDLIKLAENTQQQSAENISKERLHKLEMPDSFWLMLDQNNALTIGWEGDFKKDGSYWSSTTGIGDKTCTELHFSLGGDFRTTDVTIKASEDYYADFSPVDTKLIIKSIADKDRFKLCGYEFVLKGTRSLLRKHEFYREYLDIGFKI